MTPAVLAARRANIHFRIIEFDPGTGRQSAEAAGSALGVSPDMIFKTLVVKLDGTRLVMALVPMTAELDLQALATLAGAKRAVLARPEEAERSTGYAVGGISPLGRRRNLDTYLDSAVMNLTRVYVSAGRKGLELELAPKDLVAASGARVGAIAH